MDKRCARAQQGLRANVARFCFLVLFTLPISVDAEPSLISIEECELNGFSLGGTFEEMRRSLGEPKSVSLEMNAGDDYSHLEAHYEGLHIVFSMHGRTALNYFVTSSEYRLRSGVGVGSTRQDIESALGQTSYYKSGDTVFMVYRLAGPSGRALPVQFDISLDGDVAVGLSLISR